MIVPAAPIFAHYSDSQGKYIYSLPIVFVMSPTTPGNYPMLVLFDSKLQFVHQIPNLMSVDHVSPIQKGNLNDKAKPEPIVLPTLKAEKPVKETKAAKTDKPEAE